MPVIVAPRNPPRVVVVQRRATAAVQTPAREALIAQARESVKTVSANTRTVEVGSRGAQGPKGDPGGTTITRPAGEALSALRVVYELAGAAYMLDPTSDEQVGLIVGLALTAAPAAGAEVTIQALDVVEDASWSWAIGPVFAGPAGTLTQTPPSEGWEVVVGWASSPTRLLLSFDEPVLL